MSDISLINWSLISIHSNCNLLIISMSQVSWCRAGYFWWRTVWQLRNNANSASQYAALRQAPVSGNADIEVASFTENVPARKHEQTAFARRCAVKPAKGSKGGRPRKVEERGTWVDVYCLICSTCHTYYATSKVQLQAQATANAIAS